MKKFQTVSYVFGLVAAVVIVVGFGVKVGESVFQGARAEMCETRPEPDVNCSPSTSGGGTPLAPDYPCTDTYEDKVDGQNMTHIVTESEAEYACTQFTNDGILGVYHCNIEAKYIFSDDCVETCR